MLKYVILTTACITLLTSSAHASWVIDPPSSDPSDPDAPPVTTFNDSAFRMGNFTFNDSTLLDEDESFGNPATPATYRSKTDNIDVVSSSALHPTAATAATDSKFTGTDPFSAREDFETTAKTTTKVGGDGVNKFGASGANTPIDIDNDNVKGVASMDDDEYVDINKKEPATNAIRDFNF